MNTLRYLITIALAACVRIALGQADVAVNVDVQNPRPAANELVYATVTLENEGQLSRNNLTVGLRLSPALFFVDVIDGSGFDANTQLWQVSKLDTGEVVRLRVAVQANYGGVHTLTAELLDADMSDWDSEPGNNRLAEDDQDEVCISVPITLECDQKLVLSAPPVYDNYQWYRDGELLAYATSDTLHPSGTGAYTFVVDGEGCASGNCCPVLIERRLCSADLALTITDGELDQETGFQDITITIFNQGSETVSRVELYATISRKMRLNPGNSDWTFSLTEMTTAWTGVLHPGEESTIEFQIQSVSGGSAKDYTMTAEITAFYNGETALVDIDSDPDSDPTNDAFVDNAIDLPREQDEDDSDIVVLTDCPFITIAGNTATCTGETLKLTTSAPGKPVSYEWSGPYAFDCTTCPEVSFPVRANGSVTLRTTTEDGCVQQQVVDVQTRECLSALAITVGPGKTDEVCLPEAYRAVAWCENFDLPGVTLSLNPNSSETRCIEGASDGSWGGLREVCLEACTDSNGSDCDEATLTLIGLPRADELVGKAGELLCIGEVLQVDAQAVNVELPRPQHGVSLIGAGDGCYRVDVPSYSYPDVRFQIVHTYSLGGTTVYDTTFVDVPGEQICNLDVFPNDTLVYEASTTQGLSADDALCLAGSRPVLAMLDYDLDGEPLEAPTDGCEPYELYTFAIPTLPRGYSDDGWRILRYMVGGRSVIANVNAPNLAAVAARIEAYDPRTTVQYSASERMIKVSDYEIEPTALIVSHLASGRRISVYAEHSDGFKGYRFALPSGLPFGDYTLSATDAEGCKDATVLRVIPPNQLQQVRDTVEVTVELGEPLVVSGMAGLQPPSPEWTALNDDLYTFRPTRLGGPAYYTFQASNSSQEIYRTCAVTTTERACAPLITEQEVTATANSRGTAYVDLGLTRPDLALTYSSGRLTSASEVRGSRAGGVFELASLPYNGLTSEYRVRDWPGVPRAEGVRGNIVGIFRQLREAGQDARIDWNNNTILAAGANIGKLTLEDAESGQTYVLEATANSLATYGRFLARTGNTVITAKASTCSARITVRVEEEIIFGGGGWFGLTAGTPSTYSFADLDLPSTTARMRIVEPPAKMQAKLGANGVSVEVNAPNAGQDEMLVEVCDEKGDCELVRVQLEAKDAEAVLADIWRPETLTIQANGVEGTATFVLPEGYDIETASVTLDGKKAGISGTPREVVVERSYALADQKRFVRLATPFGKTAPTTTDYVADLTSIYPDGKTELNGEELTVVGANFVGTPHALDADGIWRPMKARAEKKQARYVLSLPVGSHSLEVKLGNGTTDKLRVNVVAPEVQLIQDLVEVSVGESGEYCLPAQAENRTVVSTTNVCTDRSGEFVIVTENENCLALEAFEPGVEHVCIVRSYLDGGRDSIQLDVRVSSRFAMATANDRDTVEMGQFKVLEVLGNDALSDEPRMVSLISEPFFGRAQVVGNTAIEYLHYGRDCAVDVFTYEVCQGEVCDSATVQIDVFCEDLLVYNGFSPNGDGVNDEFTVVGLRQYPGSTLSIFDRDGIMLIEFTDYSSDWSGEVEGQPLPSGTYFYVIDLADGTKNSGYLQLSR